MSKYIDKDKLIEHINKYANLSFWAKIELIENVKNEPVVDVVEVVRCKDCEFWKTSDCHIDYKYFSETNKDDFAVTEKRKRGVEPLLIILSERTIDC